MNEIRFRYLLQAISMNMYLLFVLLIPPVQLFLNPNLFLPSHGSYIDTWIYTGYFLNLPYHLREFEGAYYGSRLPWILPGYIAHSLLTPVAANYILHLLFYYALLIFTYLLVSKATDRLTGSIATLLMAWCPGIRMAFWWDYVDAAGIVFIVGAMFCVEFAITKKNNTSWLLLSGISCACAAYTNLFLAPLCAVFALHYLLRNRNHHQHPLFSSFMYAFAGAVLVTTLFGIINKMVGGDFLFFMPSLKFAVSFRGQVSQWKPPNYNWLWNAYWLVIPVVALVGAPFVLFREYRNLKLLKVDFPLAAQVDLLLVCTFFLYFEPKSGILAQYYYVSYLLPFCIIALAVQLYRGTSGTPCTKGFLIVLISLPFLALPFVLGPSSLTGGFKESAYVITALIIGMLGVAVLQPRRFPSLRLAAFLLSMGILNMVVSSASGILQTSETPSSTELQVRFEYICKAHRFISDHAEGKKLRFWYDYNDPLGPRVFRALSSTYLWGYCLINERYPSITKEDSVRLSSISRLVVLLPKGEVPQKAETTLASFGISLTPIVAQSFDGKDVAFGVFLFDIEMTPPCPKQPPDLANAADSFEADIMPLGRILDTNEPPAKVFFD